MFTFVVPTYNNEATIGKCLASIEGQTCRDYEIIVVDGNSSDKTREICERFGVEFILLEAKLNPAVKRNVGAAKAKGDILCFIDSDCVLPADYLTNVSKVFEEKNADAVSGMTLPSPESNFIGYLTGLEYEARFNSMGDGYVSVAASTCLSVRKEAFLDVDGFIEIFNDKAVGEDWDLSARLVQKGFKIYHSNLVKVFHDTSDSLLSYLRSQFYHAFYRPIHSKRYGRYSDEYSGFILSSVLLLNIPYTLRLYGRTNNIKTLALIPLSIIRSMVWLIGATVGTIKVWLK